MVSYIDGAVAHDRGAHRHRLRVDKVPRRRHELEDARRDERSLEVHQCPLVAQAQLRRRARQRQGERRDGPRDEPLVVLHVDVLLELDEALERLVQRAEDAARRRLRPAGHDVRDVRHVLVLAVDDGVQLQVQLGRGGEQDVRGHGLGRHDEVVQGQRAVARAPREPARREVQGEGLPPLHLDPRARVLARDVVVLGRDALLGVGGRLVQRVLERDGQVGNSCVQVHLRPSGQRARQLDGLRRVQLALDRARERRLGPLEAGERVVVAPRERVQRELRPVLLLDLLLLLARRALPVREGGPDGVRRLAEPRAELPLAHLVERLRLGQAEDAARVAAARRDDDGVAPVLRAARRPRDELELDVGARLRVQMFRLRVEGQERKGELGHRRRRVERPVEAGEGLRGELRLRRLQLRRAALDELDLRGELLLRVVEGGLEVVRAELGAA